jgi:pyrroloquinoline quinone biosynthesis protein E
MSLGTVLANIWRMRAAVREVPLITSSLPARADIEPTTFCNFRCPHCPTTETHPGAPTRTHLSLHDFTRILDQLPAVYRLKLVGLGEPLLNPEFFAMVSAARRRHLRVLTTTNGSLLDADRRRALLACGIDHVNISIDAAHPETHARLRPGSDLEQIGADLAALMRERGRRKSPQIRVWHVIQREAVPELPDLVRLCHTWGVDGLYCSAKLTNFGSASLEHVVTERRALADDLQRVLPEARRRAEAAGLPFRCPEAPPPPSTPEHARPCRWLWSRIFISARGEVRPCPYAAGPEGLSFGRLFAEDGSAIPFAESWNGAAAQRLREQVRTHHNPSFCRACFPAWQPEGGGIES